MLHLSTIATVSIEDPHVHSHTIVLDLLLQVRRSHKQNHNTHRSQISRQKSSFLHLLARLRPNPYPTKHILLFHQSQNIPIVAAKFTITTPLVVERVSLRIVLEVAAILWIVSAVADKEKDGEEQRRIEEERE